jgi:aryl-alcohol dehydrogenase-like predicted oxidoreductase
VWDAFTPVEDVVRALDDAVSAGKVLYVGISDTPAWLVSQAVTLADLGGKTRFAGLQVPYSLVWRDVERHLLPMAQALDLAVTTWGAFGSGLLSGRYGSDRARPEGNRIATTELGAQMLTDATSRSPTRTDRAQSCGGRHRPRSRRGGAPRAGQPLDALGTTRVTLLNTRGGRLAKVGPAGAGAQRPPD